MAHDYLHSRSLTVAIPKSYANGQCCPRRPGLSEILANTASPPWTLSAFMAYLSQNHCLETLEFTMDASRYRKHYNKMASRNPGTPVSPKSEECAYVKMLWQRLLDAYIAPNGPREVNLPSDVRNSLLALSDPHMPPHPSTLDQAVEKVYELMEESVLVPFLNSVYPQTITTDIPSEDHVSSSYGLYQPSSHPNSQSRNAPLSSSAVTSSHRASAPATFARSLGPITQHSRYASGPARFANAQSSSYGSSNSDALTDDSGSASSPSVDPVTPPTTPPTGEHGGSWASGIYGNGYTSAGGSNSAQSSAANSPKSSRGEHASLANATANQWKRVSSKLGWRRKSASQLREEAESHPEQ